MFQVFALKWAIITHWFWRGENTKHLHFKNKRISFRSNCCKMRLFVDFSKTMANQGKECRKWMISAATHVMFHTPRKWFKRGQKVELLKECCTVKQIGNFISDLRSNGVARYHFFFLFQSQWPRPLWKCMLSSPASEHTSNKICVTLNFH